MRRSNEDEMLLAFVQAEFATEHFDLARKVLGVGFGGDPDFDTSFLADRSNLGDPAGCLARKIAVALARGYGLNLGLFRGFPTDVGWVRVRVTRGELGAFRYINDPTWVAPEEDFRLVRDGPALAVPGVRDQVIASIRAFERGVAEGRHYPELIAVAESPDKTHILVEGHKRATAYFRTPPPDSQVEMIVGYSPNVSGWFYSSSV
jgi:hypothetical protein